MRPSPAPHDESLAEQRLPAVIPLTHVQLANNTTAVLLDLGKLQQAFDAFASGAETVPGGMEPGMSAARSDYGLQVNASRSGRWLHVAAALAWNGVPIDTLDLRLSARRVIGAGDR